MTQLKAAKKEGLTSGFFSEIFDSAKLFGRNWLDTEFGKLPAVNITETSGDFTLEFSVPGFRKEDFKIDLEDNTLTISAENENETLNEGKKFTRKEFSYNSFSRSFSLPESAAGDKISAEYQHGILSLHIPKNASVKQKPKQEIKVS